MPGVSASPLTPHAVGVSFLASPSMVWPAVGGISTLACADLSSSDFMPSLKPFTAPPRSAPMLRSFLVPKMRTTTSSTISQCQMLSEPMFLLLKRSRSAAGLLFLDSRYSFAAPQLGEHVLGREAVPCQHDQAVKPQVGGLAHDLP